jgi:CRP-like cAMP-binding protein
VLAQDTVGALALPAADFQQVLQEYPKVRPFLEGLTADRLKASREAALAGGLVDPDDVVVL